MAMIFERVINVIDHFDSYNHIEQIADLSTRVKVIRNELCIRVKKEFEESFSNPFTKVKICLTKKIKVFSTRQKKNLINC